MMNHAVRQIGDLTVIDLQGHFSPGKTITDRRVLHDLVSEQVNRGCDKILLNLREVTYIDSSGLGDLLEAASILQRCRGQLRLCSPTERVSAVLQRTNLDSVLNLDEDEASALQAFGSDPQNNTTAE